MGHFQVDLSGCFNSLGCAGCGSNHWCELGTFSAEIYHILQHQKCESTLGSYPVTLRCVFKHGVLENGRNQWCSWLEIFIQWDFAASHVWWHQRVESLNIINIPVLSTIKHYPQYYQLFSWEFPALPEAIPNLSERWKSRRGLVSSLLGLVAVHLLGTSHGEEPTRLLMAPGNSFSWMNSKWDWTVDTVCVCIEFHRLS